MKTKLLLEKQEPSIVEGLYEIYICKPIVNY